MAVVNGYCATGDVRSQLSDDAARLDLALLERAVNATSRAIDRYCHRRFWLDAAPTTRTFRADEPDVVWIDDITKSPGLVVKTDDAGDGTFSTTWAIDVDFGLEPADVDVVADGDTVTPYAFWRITAVGARRFPVFDRRRGVQVTDRFGWSSIPDEVPQAAILKATSLFRRKDAPFGVAGFGDMGVVRITRQDVDVVDLLDEYVKRRPRRVTYRPQRYSLFHARLT